ncbi:MAG: DUF6444 domain-containing protein [Cyanobacteriota bacterium]
MKDLVMQLITQLETLSARVAELEEQIGRSSRNSFKLPFSDGSGFKPPAKEKSKGTGRKRGGQDGHPGASRNLLPTQQADVIPHFPSTWRSCGESLSGEDPEPHRHQVVGIPKIESFVIEHQLHRLTCPHCRTTTCARTDQKSCGSWGSGRPSIGRPIQGPLEVTLS